MGNFIMNFLTTTAGKLLAAGTLAAGLTFGGITWLGGGHITDIKGNVDSLTAKVTQAVEDSEFLKGQFDSLKGMYTDSVTEANGKIGSLTSERDRLTAEVDSLQTQLDNVINGDNAEGEAYAAEVARLEGELNKANAEIAELAGYVKQAEESVTYTPIDRSQYTATEQDITDIPVPISGEAAALDATKAGIMASPEKVAWIEKQLDKTLPPAAIIGVTTYTTGGKTYLAYEVAETFTTGGISIPYELQQFIGNDLGYMDLYFITSNGFVAKANKTGTFSVIKQ